MNFIQTLLIDGYISQTFQSRAAEQYFLDLLKSTSIPPYGTYHTKRKVYLFYVHSRLVPPHIPAQFSNPPDLWLLDYGIVNRGTVVPQTMWSPISLIDIRRHIETAELRMPVFFEDKDGRVGISLGECVDGQCRALLDPKGPAPLGQKTTTHIRIVWPGYKEFKRQIPLRDDSRARNPITMAKFVGHVGRSVNAFLQVCELDSESEDVRRELWRIGPGGIRRRDITIIGVIHVSAGTWMPIMQLNRYIF